MVVRRLIIMVTKDLCRIVGGYCDMYYLSFFIGKKEE